jgi:hypothetical protein
MSLNKQKIKLVLTTLVALTTLASVGQAAAVSTKSSTSTKSTSASSSTSKNASAPTTSTLSNDVTQSYDAEASVKTGMLVMFNPKDKTTVVPLTEADIKQLLGVVIPTTNATIVLTPSNASPSQVLVDSTGEEETLVSDQNGPIKSGDYLGISAIAGISMEANNTQPTVVGRAEATFNGRNGVLDKMQVKNSFGQSVTVDIGSIPVDIGITHNPTFKKQAKSDYVPGFIGKIVFQVTSKNVSAAHVYIAIVILFGLIILTSNMLFGGLKGGMIAVGRQPLSKKSITISLIQTTFFAMAIFVGGIVGIYTFLKL